MRVSNAPHNNGIDVAAHWAFRSLSLTNEFESSSPEKWWRQITEKAPHVAVAV